MIDACCGFWKSTTIIFKKRDPVAYFFVLKSTKKQQVVSWKVLLIRTCAWSDDEKQIWKRKGDLSIDKWT